MKDILIPAKRLTKIAYAEKPLLQFTAGDHIQYLTPAEFETQFGFSYNESLYGNRSEIQDVLNNQELLQHFSAGRLDVPCEAAVLERLQNPLDCLVICNMGDVGCGLFTNRPITKGTILFLYAGELDEPVFSSDSKRNMDYLWLSDREKPNISSKVINASNQGGLARFMQHLPSDFTAHSDRMKMELKRDPRTAHIPEAILNNHIDELLAPCKEDDEVGTLRFHNAADKARLAISNVKLCSIVIRGIPCVVCIADDNLSPNTQLGFCYGKQYWLTSRSAGPRYWFKDSSLIPLSAYARIDGTTSNSASNSVFFNKAIPKALYDQGVAFYKQKQFDEAVKKIDAAQKIYVSQGKQLEQSSCLDTLASCHREMGVIDLAIECCQQALILRQSLLPIGSALIEKTRTKLVQLQRQSQSANSQNQSTISASTKQNYKKI